MKRILVALMMECEPVYEAIKVASKHGDELSEETLKFVQSCLDGYKRIMLRKMMGN